MKLIWRRILNVHSLTIDIALFPAHGHSPSMSNTEAKLPVTNVFTFQHQQGQVQLAVLFIRKLLHINTNKFIVICPGIVLPFISKALLYIFIGFLLFL